MSKHLLGGTAAVIAALAVAFVQTIAGQEFSSALTLPFSTTAVGSSGGVQTSGSFRILQFAEQNGQAYAVGTLTIGVPDQASTTGATDQGVAGQASTTGTSARSFVTQAVVPVLAVTSRATTAALTFGTGNTATAATGQSVAGSLSVPITTAGVPTSSVPGQAANCGPLHVELGPIDVNQSGVALHLNRLAVDIAPPSGGVSTMLSQVMCSADAALVQAANAGTTAGAFSQQPGAFGAPTAGMLTPGVPTSTAGVPTTTAAVPTATSPVAGANTSTGNMTGVTTFGGATTTSGTFSAVASTPLQAFVFTLNQVIGML